MGGRRNEHELNSRMDAGGVGRKGRKETIMGEEWTEVMKRSHKGCTVRTMIK